MRKYLILFSFFLLLGLINSASADIIGNDILDRPSLDGATNIAFIDPTLKFTTAGTLDSFDFWLTAQKGDDFALQIYRYTGTDYDWEVVYSEYWLLDDEYITSVDDSGSLPADNFQVQADDVVGWWFGAGGGVIPYTVTGEDDVQWTHWTGSGATPIYTTAVGNIYSFNTDSWSNSSQKREYSIAVNFTPVPEPASMLLLGSGLAGLVGFRRKFKK